MRFSRMGLRGRSISAYWSPRIRLLLRPGKVETSDVNPPKELWRTSVPTARLGIVRKITPKFSSIVRNRVGFVAIRDAATSETL